MNLDNGLSGRSPPAEEDGTMKRIWFYVFLLICFVVASCFIWIGSTDSDTESYQSVQQEFDGIYRIAANPDSDTENDKIAVSQKQIIICIDPGHGTKRSRVGTNGEAKVTLSVAKELGNQLKANPDTKIVYTHTELGQDLDAKNADDDNRIRAQIANKSGALLFVRLHADAPQGKAAIYYPDKHPNRFINKESRLAAEYIWTQIKSVLPSSVAKGGTISETKTAVGAKRGGLLVGSRYSEVPVVTIEMVPMSVVGKVWIQQKNNQQALVQAIARGIYNYLQYYFEQNISLENPPNKRRVLLI